MQWRGWSTYSDIVAVWSWLDTEQSMINFTTEIVKVCVRVRGCARAYVCVSLFKCACMWVHLHAHTHRKILDRQSIDE